MNYAGALKAPTQSTKISTQTDVSWVGPGPVTRQQRPAASVTNMPVTSVLRSVGTTTCIADMKKHAARPDHRIRRRVNNPPNPLRQSNRVHLFLSMMHSLQMKGKLRIIPLL